MNAQNSAILAHLKSGKTITSLQAFTKFNCLRLSARIYDLKDAGHTIERAMIKAGEKHVAQYWMPTQTQKKEGSS